MSKGLSSVKTLTAKEIAKKWNLSLKDVSKKIAAGVKVEKEHTKSTRQANEIARDHLGERPDYYDKLDKMEKTKIVKEMDTSRMPFSKNIEDRRPTTGQDWQSRILKAGSYVSGAIGDIKNATVGPDKPDMNLGKKAEPLNTGRPATSAKEGSTGDGRKEYGRFEDDPRSGEGYRTQTPGSWNKYTDSIAAQGSSGRGTPGPVTPGSKGGSITTPKPPAPKLEPEDVWHGGFNAKAKQSVVKEETGISGVRGLGYVSGDPSGTDYVEKYVNTNAMSYQDVNGDKLKFIEKSHKRLHDRKLGFKEYDPTKIKTLSNFMSEMTGTEHGIGGDHNPVPEDSDYIVNNIKGTERDSLSRETYTHHVHHKHHADNGFNTFRHSNVKKHSNSPLKVKTIINELGGDYDRSSQGVDVIGDLTGASKKIAKIDELKKVMMKEDLRKWFKEKWVRYDTKGNIKGPCAREDGEGKPKCRPLASARAMSKEERAKSARRKRREDPVADRSGKGGKPIMVKTNEETLLEKNVPTNPALWAKAKSQAKSKFDVYPSAYANGWAAKWYKSKGGGWKTASESVEEECWSGYQAKGMKKKGNRMVPNCVPKEEKNLVPANTTERGIYEADDIDYDRALAAFRKKETGSYEGKYDSAGKKGRSASGAYQFIDKTWRGVTKNQGIGTEYKHASDAPREVQDKVMRGELESNVKKYGSLEKAVNVHYTGNPMGRMSAKASAANAGQGASKYYADFQKNMTSYTPPQKQDTSSQVASTTAPKPVTPTPTPAAPTTTDASTFVRRQLAMKESKKKLDEIAVDLPPNIESPPAYYQQAPAKRFSRSVRNVTTRMGSGAGAMRGGVQVQRAAPSRPTSARMNASQGGSMSAQVQTQRAAPMRGITSTMPSRGSGGANAMSAKPTVGAGGLNKSEFMGRSMTSKMADGLDKVSRGMSKAIAPAAEKGAAVAGSALSRSLGAVARVAGGPAATAAMAVMEPTPAGEKQSEFQRQDMMKKYNPFKSQGRSIADYEKQQVTRKSASAPTAAEAPKPTADVPTPPSRPGYFTRGQAFSAARKEAGGGEGKFSYQSGSDTAPKEYQTNRKDKLEPYKPESQLKQTSVKEETKMNTKELINEALDNIIEDNLVDMKENFMAALQEKAIEKLEERKKIIASDYFAQ